MDISSPILDSTGTLRYDMDRSYQPGGIMKTLYVSDLDGTLLRSDESLSPFTCQTIHDLVSRGMLFSYATARSHVTASKVTKGLDAKIPLIVYNGAMVIDNVTGEILLSNFFDSDVLALLDELIRAGIYPIVYSFQNGVELFSYIPGLCSKAALEFLCTRKGDRRDHPVETIDELFSGDIFYVTCIDDEEKLAPFCEAYQERYHCIYQRDVYTDEQWLEFMPLAASKSNAIRQLKELLHCDKLVVFGDGKNDIDMFQLADASYAVENAVPELKAEATEVIGRNDEDGVARWLLSRSMDSYEITAADT